MNKMKETMVLYTWAGAGHLTAMVSLAKQFIRRGFSVTIVTFNSRLNPGSVADEAARISTTNPSISFRILPDVSLGDNENLEGLAIMQAAIRANNANLLQFLTSLSKTDHVRDVVLDFFCYAALDVTNQLGIPAYFFISFGVSAIAVLLHFLEIHEASTISFKDMGKTLIPFAGVLSLTATDVPTMLSDHDTQTYKGYIEILSSLIKADGFLINSFELLEPKALAALREGLCLAGCTMPPIYPIGPVGNARKEKEDQEERHESLAWLDSQPKSSVIFLCFGSMGAFTPDQIKKIAAGLENSGQRFLWVVKVTDDRKKMFEHRPVSDLGTILPEGFLDRTKDRGMIVKSWAPQVQILQHESVGGFATHCGWNSILEAATAGVPMICWPLYAEQRINKTALVEEIKIGVVMEGYDEVMVEAEEVEKKVRWLMEAEGRNAIKKRVVEVKEKADEALKENGSSSKAFIRFLEDLREKMSEGI